MICAWDELIGILPLWMRMEVDQIGRDKLNELRLRLHKPAELCLHNRTYNLRKPIESNDLNYILNAASKYSPWSSESITKGYITAAGGHRIGICGNAAIKNGQVAGYQSVSSLCIRVARDFPGCARTIGDLSGSTIILGAPGWGKTTLLRDLARQISQKQCVCVVDERCELFPSGLDTGLKTDILSSAPKSAGIDMVMRTMTPNTIVVDEITAQEDSEALLRAFHCGVRLLATAHASSLEDYLKRNVYQPLVQGKVFENFIIMKPDKSFTVERVVECK